MSKIKILYVIPSLGHGGAERQFVELIKGLDKNNYEIYVAVLNGDQNHYFSLITEIADGIIELYKDNNAINKWIALRKTIHLLHIDVIHGFLALGSFYAASAAILTNIPVISSSIREGKDTKASQKWINRLLPFISFRFVSNSEAGFASRYKKWRKNFQVIYNGIDPQRFQLAELPVSVSAVAQEFGLSPTVGRLIGMVATLSVNKDHDSFIELAAQLAPLYDDVGFLIIGDGARRTAVQQQIERRGLTGRVAITGRRYDVERLTRVLTVSVLFTNALRHAEGVSNAILEAMALSIPVVATDSGGADEAIDHAESGFLVPAYDVRLAKHCVEQLLINPELVSKMTSTAQARVWQQFSLQRMVADYTAIYVAAHESC